MHDEKAFDEEVNIKRLSLFAFLLWSLGFLIIFLTVYAMIIWEGWLRNLKDTLFVIVAITVGISAIAIGALIDMHTMQ